MRERSTRRRRTSGKVPEETFDFMDDTFGQLYSARTGQARIGYRPLKQSIKHIVRKSHALTAEATGRGSIQLGPSVWISWDNEFSLFKSVASGQFF